MNTAILLCAAILAADRPNPVQAKILYGGDAEQQHRADVEPWIREATAKYGSPQVQPHTGWISLSSDDSQRLFSGNGFYIDGKATQQGGNCDVEIEACAGFSLDQKATLKRGERRVIKLTDLAAPNNVFIALEAPLSPRAKKRSEALMENAKNLVLELQYNGAQDKPFYQMIVSVPVVNRPRNSPFNRITQINEEQAVKIIDHLARLGFLDTAVDLRTNIKIPAPSMPGYTMTATVGNQQWFQDLGWGLPMIHRIDALRQVLPDNGQKDADLLLGRLSGLRAQWEAKSPPFKVDANRSQVQFLVDKGKTIIDIESKLGIDKAIIKRESPQWPQTMLVRLHLRGLELFHVSNGEISLDWSVNSAGDNGSTVFLREGLDETAVDKTNPYHAPVRVLGGNGEIPLKDGYFEINLPTKLFERNPDEIKIEWIDFYRN